MWTGDTVTMPPTVEPSARFWQTTLPFGPLRNLLRGRETLPENEPLKKLRDRCSLHLKELHPNRDELTRRERSDLENRLLPVVALVREWHRHITMAYGQDFYQRARELFPGDPQTHAWLDLFQEIARSHKQDALENLITVGTVGLKWTLASGKQKTVFHQDFGLTFIWIVTDRVECRLAKNPRPPATVTTPTAAANIAGGCTLAHAVALPAAQPSQNSPNQQIPGRPIVWIDVNREGLVILKYDDKTTRKLGQQASKLLLALMRADNHMPSDEDLCKELYGEKPTAERWESGPLNRLKSQVYSANAAIKERLGKVNLPQPPNGKRWIEREESDGFYLNRSMDWQYLLEKQFRAGPIPLSPRKLAGALVDHRERQSDEDEENT